MERNVHDDDYDDDVSATGTDRYLYDGPPYENKVRLTPFSVGALLYTILSCLACMHVQSSKVCPADRSKYGPWQRLVRLGLAVSSEWSKSGRFNDAP